MQHIKQQPSCSPSGLPQGGCSQGSCVPTGFHVHGRGDSGSGGAELLLGGWTDSGNERSTRNKTGLVTEAVGATGGSKKQKNPNIARVQGGAVVVKTEVEETEQVEFYDDNENNSGDMRFEGDAGQGDLDPFLDLGVKGLSGAPTHQSLLQSPAAIQPPLHLLQHQSDCSVDPLLPSAC